MVSPIGGVDSRVPVSSNNPLVCIYAYNIVPSEYGLRVRSGYREHQVGIGAGNNLGIRTIIPFKAATDNAGDDKLFAVTNEGIFDVTIEGGDPILVWTFANTGNDAGWGNYAHYITGGGDELVFYADPVNGLVQYNQLIDAWEVPTGIVGIDPSVINFVVVHKLRIWFCVANSNIGYYLPVLSIAGEVESFNFGAKFKHGGRLIGLYNWTVDGGDGVDDFLIAISSAGDVLPYKGSDPSQGDWTLVGTYFAGATVKGGRAASQYGGNVNLLTTYGFMQMSDLLRGVDPRLPNEDSIGSKISPIIRQEMPQYRDDYGWDVKFLQSEGFVIITSPQRINGEYIQYVYNQAVGGWGFWRGVPIVSVDSWKSSVYFGTLDGRVYVMDTNKDNVQIDPPEPLSNGQLIPFSLLHNYQDLGQPAIFKRGKLIRPNFLSTQKPAYDAKFFYDYDVGELTSVPPNVNERGYLWDLSIWDLALWSSVKTTLHDRVIGGGGIGRYVSVAIKGQAVSGTILASTDISWDTGWFL